MVNLKTQTIRLVLPDVILIGQITLFPLIVGYVPMHMFDYFCKRLNSDTILVLITSANYGDEYNFHITCHPIMPVLRSVFVLKL